MLSGMKNFCYRHKKKILVCGLVIGGAVLAKKYSQKKLIEWQEELFDKDLERRRKEQHFRSTEKTCNQTISTLAQTLEETVKTLINTDELLTKIRRGKHNKVLLWETLKVQVFAQISTLLYSGLMLVIVLRIQLNVIGGYMFREKMDSQKHDLFSSAFQEHYLSLCHYFLNKGVKDICTLMNAHAQLVLKNMSLKQKLSLQDLQHIFWAIQSSLNKDPLDPIKNLSKYLLPPVFKNTVYEGVDSEQMKQIVDETFEILDSEEVKSIADSCIKQAFSNVVDKLASAYYEASQKISTTTGNDGSDFNNITMVSIPLAKIVPLIHGLFKDSGENDAFTSSWICQFLIMDNVNTLGANLYDSFSQAV